MNSLAITIASVTSSAEREFGKVDGGVSALGVSHFADVALPPKIPQRSTAEKPRCNRIKHLRRRPFGAEALKRTAARSSDSKWPTDGQLPTRE